MTKILRVARVMSIATIAALVLAGCSTTPTAGPVPLSCQANPPWAVGDSVGQEVSIGIPGWPDVRGQYGRWWNLSVPGAKAADLSTWITGAAAACPEKPRLIVLQAGINDLAQGATAADLEATVSNFVATAGVPVRVVAITPLPRNGKTASLAPAREQYNAWLDATLPDVAIDCNSVLADSDGWLRTDYVADLLIHLTVAGEDALGTCIGAAAL